MSDDDRKDYGERRQVACGLIRGRLFVCVFTDRGEIRRVISLRKANSQGRSKPMRRKITPDMSKAALAAVDWAAMDAVTDAEIERQIAADSNVAPEILPVDVKAIRSATGLSQGLFAARYRIPVGTLRDWEQGRKPPDSTARAYLHVIARNPDMVARALEG